MTVLTLNKHGQILIIAGPTATGKTSLALKLAQTLSADIVSADSRQVYAGLDIIPGKDIPSGFHKQESPLKHQGKNTLKYTDGNISLYGYDIIHPDQEWNLSYFHKYTWKAVKHIWSRNRLPIITGGTGLYLKSLITDLPQIHIPNDPKLRARLENKSIVELQATLNKVDQERFAQMNNSDKNNPRRLVRALEIASYLHDAPTRPKTNPKADILSLALTAPLLEIEKRISDRVSARLKSEVALELDLLKKYDPELSSPASTAFGYRELDDYLSKKITKLELIKLWNNHELNYAKRQLTWLRSQSNYEWIDVTNSGYPDNVVDLVHDWYIESSHEEI